MADDVALDGQPEDAGQETGEQEQAQPDVAQLLNEIKALRRENAKWAQEARTRAEQDRRQVAIRSQVVTAAAKAGFNDPEDAYRMLDASTLDVDDNGTAGGLDVALKDLLKTKPYLAKQATPGTYSPTNPAGGSPQESDQARMARIYGTGGGKSGVFGGSGGGVVWNTKPE